MISVSALKYWIWLTQLKGLGNQTRLALLQHFGSPEEVYYADPQEVLLTPKITRSQAKVLEDKSLDEADSIQGECQRLHIDMMTLQDAHYPARLKNIYDPPCLLYWKGNLPAIDEEAAVAVVGTRNATPYGIATAEKLGYGLAAGGAPVVTGLAHGIDEAAAHGALQAGGCTIGVLGNGIDVIYPRGSRYLYEDVAAAGVLISEYPPGTDPVGRHFPIRNRIMSGLSVATLVVEAPDKSGALITAETALEQSRDVFAVPGPIDAEKSRGCNHLIRDGAGLVMEPWDILREYQPLYPGKIFAVPSRKMPETLGYRERKKREEVQAKSPVKPLPNPLSLSRSDVSLTDDQICILHTLTDEPMLVDDLIEATELPTRRVLSALTVLEIDNYVVQQSGKRFIRNVILTE